jgi:hypothetical protein
VLKSLPILRKRLHGLHKRGPFGRPKHHVNVVLQPHTNIVRIDDFILLNGRLQSVGERKCPDRKKSVAQLQNLEDAI